MNLSERRICGNFYIYGYRNDKYYLLMRHTLEDVAKRNGYKFSMSRAVKDIFSESTSLPWASRYEVCCNIDNEKRTLKLGILHKGTYLGNVNSHVWAGLCAELFIVGGLTPQIPKVDGLEMKIPCGSTDGWSVRFFNADYNNYAEHSEHNISSFEDDVQYVGMSRFTYGLTNHASQAFYTRCNILFVKKAYLEELVGCSFEDIEKFLPTTKLWPLSTLTERDCLMLNGRIVSRKSLKQLCDMDMELFLNMLEKTDHSVKMSGVIQFLYGQNPIYFEMPPSDYFYRDGTIDTQTLCFMTSFNIANGQDRQKYRIIKEGINLKAEKI